MEIEKARKPKVISRMNFEPESTLQTDPDLEIGGGLLGGSEKGSSKDLTRKLSMKLMTKLADGLTE